MFAFAVLFVALWILTNIGWRLLSSYTAGTPLGAAVAYVH